MKDEKMFKGIPPEGLGTPKGFLYYPPKQGRQVLFLIASFLTAILLGWTVSSIPGDLSGFASGVIYFVFLLVFFLGYAVWRSLANALVFSNIKWPLIKMISKIFLRKEKPESLGGFLPEREKMAGMIVSIQKYTRAFFIISWPIGITGGFITLFMSTSFDSSILFLLIFSGSVLYGYALFYFGRRGYLPLPEE